MEQGARFSVGDPVYCGSDKRWGAIVAVGDFVSELKDRSYLVQLAADLTSTPPLSTLNPPLFFNTARSDLGAAPLE
jgi:hypothetical protein